MFFFLILRAFNIKISSLFVDLCVFFFTSQISGVSSHSRMILTFLLDGRKSQTWLVSTTGTYPQAPLSGRGPTHTLPPLDRRNHRPPTTTQPQPPHTCWALSAPHRSLTSRQVAESKMKGNSFKNSFCYSRTDQ